MFQVEMSRIFSARRCSYDRKDAMWEIEVSHSLRYQAIDYNLKKSIPTHPQPQNKKHVRDLTQDSGHF